MRKLFYILIIIGICSCSKENDEVNLVPVNIRYEVEYSGITRVWYTSGNASPIDTITGNWEHTFTAMIPEGESRVFTCTVNPDGLLYNGPFKIRYYVNGLLRHEYMSPITDSIATWPHVWYGSAITAP